jgi:hypothetical protein
MDLKKKAQNFAKPSFFLDFLHNGQSAIVLQIGAISPKCGYLRPLGA